MSEWCELGRREPQRFLSSQEFVLLAAATATCRCSDRVAATPEEEAQRIDDFGRWLEEGDP